MQLGGVSIHGSAKHMGVIASGAYSGNDGINRAVSHGLGCVPRLAIVLGLNSDGSRRGVWFNTGTIFHGRKAGSTVSDDYDLVTVLDGVNIYVRGEANRLNTEYVWVVWG